MSSLVSARSDHAACEGRAVLPGALLDRVPIGMLLLVADGRLVWANVAARAAIAVESSELRVDGDRVLPRDPSYGAAWRTALAAAAEGGTAMLRRHGSLPRPAIVLARWRGAPVAARVVCTLPAWDGHEQETLRVYARTHGLSPSETDVLIGLARGASPKGLAQRRGSSEGTVRSQVKSILLKTGHHGIRALVVDALRSAPVLFAAADDEPDEVAGRRSQPTQ
jgi:DNA-binding CsgD family transcriptional regulator